jgi:hypothetical protein
VHSTNADIIFPKKIMQDIPALQELLIVGVGNNVSQSTVLPFIRDMPPKKTRKAKAGAILSGISRAGPGEVDIGSMVPQAAPSTTLKLPGLFINESDQESVHTKPIPSFAASSDIIGMYCHFCCEAAQPGYRHQCIECGALVCEQVGQKSRGCIYLGSVENKDDFLCPVCSRTGVKKDQPLQYAYIGFGRRPRVKMAWPMAVVNLNLESLKDDYLSTTVKIELENHYRMHPHNVSEANPYFCHNKHTIVDSCSYKPYTCAVQLMCLSLGSLQTV